MKIVANITKGGKELFHLTSVIIFTSIAVEIALYFCYQAAVEAHIPFSNFIHFMKLLIAIYSLSCIAAVVLILFFADRNGSNRKSVHRVIIYTLLSVFGFLFSFCRIPFDLSLFENIMNITGILLMFSLLLFFMFFVFNRIVTNILFRRLFTKEFQNQCEIYPDEDTFLYSISWVKLIVNFIIKYFRNAQTTVFTSLEVDSVNNDFHNWLKEINATTEEPKRIENDHNDVRIFFSWVPVSFVLTKQFRISERSIRDAVQGTSGVLSNEKNEK